MSRLFRWLMMAAGAGSRWITAKIKTGTRAKATATTARASLAEAHAKAATAVKASAEARKAAEANVNQRDAVRVRARIAARETNPVRFVRAVSTAFRAAVVSYRIVETAFRAGWITALKVAAGRAPGVSAEMTPEGIATAVTAAPCAANTVLSAAGDTLGMIMDARPTTAEAVSAGAAGNLGFRLTAKVTIAYVVAFLNTGGRELYSMIVKPGENAHDPVGAGTIPPPTRESDVQYNYTFNGWSATDGGKVDGNVLLNITAPKAVYAAYKKELRSYTINFYDYDNVTLLHSVSVPYGETPEYTPTKAGYAFDGWYPEIQPVTGDADYSAQWVEIPTFANATWAQIAEIAESGKASEYFSVGDTKKIYITRKGSVTVKIAGFNHDDLATGSGKAAMSVVLDNVVYLGKSITTSQKDTWATSPVRTEVENLYSALPADLQAIIKTVRKKYTDGTTANNILSMPCQVWALSLVELNPYYSGVLPSDGETYELFAQKSSRTLTEYGKTSGCQYPTRTNINGHSWLNIMSSGDVGYSTGGKIYYAHFGFCI